MKKIIALVLLVNAVCYPQKSQYDFKEAEANTRKLIYSVPDSALIIIKKTLAQKGSIPDTVYGNTYNLYGIYYGMKGKPDSSLCFYRKSLAYLDGYPKNKARTLLNMSISYRNKGEYKKAISLIEEVLGINRKIKNNTGIAMAYGELASNHTLMLEYDKSVDYLLKAIAILKAEKNTKQLTAIKQKLANTYLKNNNFKFAIDLYNECLDEFKAMGNNKNYYLTHLNLTEAYIHTNNFRGAKLSLKEAARGLEKFGDKELIGIAFSKLGNIEKLQGNPDKGADYYSTAMSCLTASGSANIVRIASEYINLLNGQKDYNKALAIITMVQESGKLKIVNDSDLMEFNKASADTYAGTHEDKKAIASYKKALAINDSISSAEKERAVQEMQANFQTELQREKNRALEAKNRALKENHKTQQQLMLAYIIGSVIIIILFLSILRGSKLKLKLQQEALKNIEAEKILIEQQHRHEQEINNTQKQVIEEKQRELTSQTLRMANYHDGLNHLIHKCDDNVFTKVSEVKKELQQLAKQKDYWKQFETRFNSLHPDFNNNLTGRFAKLTKNDIEFCSLLKLNLSNKEIASLLQISHESAITKKYRIKKKMDIQDDEEFEKVLKEL
ncbi:hypothetical protein CHU92_11100 [Flavobacterium cyanobacteriorum]|uniref:Uncharacterized protein n=1 Tax=Flavobacterium cyanobacteriorum TaxID=2022802 RepID=A0A255Z0X3_9FLAO|nr:tetratricopeptide repeat protein [Flavobacterium cyanobacteriorum]OYQ35118.1 hypothetical protein CHU92_11100 [Flavobacterium cyanobacteriorum]